MDTLSQLITYSYIYFWRKPLNSDTAREKTMLLNLSTIEDRKVTWSSEFPAHGSCWSIELNDHENCVENYNLLKNQKQKEARVVNL